MIVVTNRIKVASGHRQDFEARFVRRARLLESSPGFVRFELHRTRPGKLDRAAGSWQDEPSAADTFEVKTWWLSVDDFAQWTRSPAFAKAHADRPPAEMFAGPNELLLHEVVDDAEKAATPT